MKYVQTTLCASSHNCNMEQFRTGEYCKNVTKTNAINQKEPKQNTVILTKSWHVPPVQKININFAYCKGAE